MKNNNKTNILLQIYMEELKQMYKIYPPTRNDSFEITINTSQDGNFEFVKDFVKGEV